jgi:hypothetical protein
MSGLGETSEPREKSRDLRIHDKRKRDSARPDNDGTIICAYETSPILQGAH